MEIVYLLPMLFASVAALANNVHTGRLTRHEAKPEELPKELTAQMTTLLNEAFAKSEVTEKTSTLQDVVRLLMHREDFLPVATICSKLNIDKMGCLRVEAYLGKTLLDLTKPLTLTHKVNSQNFKRYDGDVTTKVGLLNPKIDTGRNPQFINYAKSFEDIPSDLMGNTSAFIFAGHDWAFRRHYKYPTLVRPAPVPDPTGNHVLIRELREHFDFPAAQASLVDIPFQDKVDVLVWRGSRTGELRKCNGQYQNGSRLLLVQKFIDSKDKRIDIGGTTYFSSTWVRPHMEMAQLLKHKFVMVVNGNGPCTEFEWVMTSNSVPFMAKPVAQTWSLHSWLKPWKHYVPVEPDFSDVSSKLDWAISNPLLAAQIAREGTAYMQEFKDAAREKRINAAVLVAYFNRFKITDSPKATMKATYPDDDHWQQITGSTEATDLITGPDDDDCPGGSTPLTIAAK